MNNTHAQLFPSLLEQVHGDYAMELFGAADYLTHSSTDPSDVVELYSMLEDAAHDRFKAELFDRLDPTYSMVPSYDFHPLPPSAEQMAAQGAKPKGRPPHPSAESSTTEVNANGEPLNEEELNERRRAQNRAAQRSFRERKDRKLKELELRFTESESNNKKLLEELKLLQQKNYEIQVENQFLSQHKNQTVTRNDPRGVASPPSSVGDSPLSLSYPQTTRTLKLFTFPSSETEFVQNMVDVTRHSVQIDKRFTYKTSDGVMVFTISALWDYLKELQTALETQAPGSQELDIGEVMSELRGQESCHGHGPAYPVDLVKDVLSRHIAFGPSV